ncbi:MAG TPA: TadE/TadG family type IV pilus assembly protein [Planctomycetaceae bacterium]|nr:TadE/TadG family type IV pilus assembly protein [Planctomycetaceae bacterium]
MRQESGHRRCVLLRLRLSPVRRDGQALSRRGLRGAARRGAAAVELALLAPFLAALILGACETGQVLRVHAMLTEAARKGCATASHPGRSNAHVLQDVNNALSAAGLSTDAATITIRINDQAGEVAGAQRNDKISVSIAIPTAKAAWTGSFVFFSGSSLRSQTTIMLRQG